MFSEPSRSIIFDAADQLTAWHRLSLEPCRSDLDAQARLTIALNLLGTDVDYEPEPGLSERQQALEQLIRSVAVHLAR